MMQALAIVPAVAGGVWSVLQPGLDPFSDEKDALTDGWIRRIWPVVKNPWLFAVFFWGGESQNDQPGFTGIFLKHF